MPEQNVSNPQVLKLLEFLRENRGKLITVSIMLDKAGIPMGWTQPSPDDVRRVAGLDSEVKQ